MNPITARFVMVCLASLAAGLVGWFAPPRRGRVQLGDCCVLAAGAMLGFIMQRDWISGLSLASLLPGVYAAFGGWQNRAEPPKAACTAAFLGASWFWLTTAHALNAVWIALVLGVGGPRIAIWVTERTSRVVGLALVSAATIFQLSRIPLLLAGDSLGSRPPLSAVDSGAVISPRRTFE